LEKEEQNTQNQSKSYRIRDLFDQILAQHFESLIGSKLGINGLPLNLVTVSCFILFTERENEISNFPNDPPARYTDETLFNALKELGLNQNEDVKPSLQDMTNKGYLEMGSDGKYTTLKSTMSMAQLLDKIFPYMPGMSLIAYFIQIIDEIQSGRKELEAGARQFHSMLRQQGHPLKPAESKAYKPIQPAVQTPEPKEGHAKTIAELLNIDLSQLSKLNESLFKSRTMQSANVLTADAKPQDIEVKKVEMEDIFSSAEQPTPAAPPPEQPALPAETGEPVATDSALPGSAPVESTVVKDSGVSEEQEEPEEEYKSEEEMKEAPPVESGPVEDDSVARQIAAFQDDLALQCPLCHVGKVKSQKTATGSTYFRCSAEDCSFISWGQPYYLTCPQCQNPFLIETTQHDGSLILKCPRATCRYWQKHPAEQITKPKVRRLVRRPKRRVVRRIVRK
jgi:ssDNA-binding Zn-finger/Zn-ribbon topoisomerase 1